MTTWEEAQAAELGFWGSCANTFDEEAMQLVAAERMGLVVDAGPIVRASGLIVDIGGGPVSLLLKAQGWAGAFVVDPGEFPIWTIGRYTEAGVNVVRATGEAFFEAPGLEPDEIWIYNTLQHVIDPHAIVDGACKLAPVVRLFEWVEFETNDCHIHTLKPDELVTWAQDAGADVDGAVESIEWRGQRNLSYHAILTRRSA